MIPTPPSGGAPQRWGPSKLPKTPCQPQPSSKTRQPKPTIQTTKTTDHPAKQPDHPSISAQKTQQPPAEPKSPLAAADEQGYTDQHRRRQPQKASGLIFPSRLFMRDLLCRALSLTRSLLPFRPIELAGSGSRNVALPIPGEVRAHRESCRLAWFGHRAGN